jgi:hypothetical protein
MFAIPKTFYKAVICSVPILPKFLDFFRNKIQIFVFIFKVLHSLFDCCIFMQKNKFRTLGKYKFLFSYLLRFFCTFPKPFYNHFSLLGSTQYYYFIINLVSDSFNVTIDNLTEIQLSYLTIQMLIPNSWRNQKEKKSLCSCAHVLFCIHVLV